jgi:peptidoglycan/xylan/chitin deacetylase (PgdA/CDA1 family)
MQKGFLILCFDDGTEETYSTVYPMLKEHGAVAVVSVITGLVGNRDLRLATLGQLQELKAEGWEMVSHSVTHSRKEWLPGGPVNLERLERELRESRDWVVRNGLGDGKTFIYPFGSQPRGLVGLVKKYYWLARATDSPATHFDLPLNEEQRYSIRSLPVKHPLSERRMDEIHARLEYVADRSAIIALTFHRVTARPQKIQDITQQELGVILDLMDSEGLKTSTFEETMRSIWGSDAKPRT